MGEVEDKVKKYLAVIKKDNKRVNAFLSLNPDALADARKVDKKKKKGRLAGVVVGVKSNICVAGLECNCASKTLAGWKAPYDATVVERLKEEDAVIIGMLNMDEFAAGASGEKSAFGATLNPVVPGRVPGGSSSGAAAAVAAGMCDVALGSDTGGSVRNPASHCGIVGFRPTYGFVSRYGLIDLAMSFDVVGPIGRDVDSVRRVLEVIAGEDERDTQTLRAGNKASPSAQLSGTRLSSSKGKKIGKTVGVVRVPGVDSRIQALVDARVAEMKKKGFSVKEVSLAHVDLGVQTYYLLVYAEFFSGTRKFDGRRFGKVIEESCGEEVLRRILGGSEITLAEHEGQWYRKALGVRELIRQEFVGAFEKVDVLVMPTVPALPWKIGEKMSVQEEYAYDVLTVLASLAGVPAVSVPMGAIEDSDRDGVMVPVGMQLVGPAGSDGAVLSVAKELSL
jgi:aspartyl-tRNA(Asn)/glutamyl-tRNA(Gln) amidotransferase subunit A